MELVMWNEPPDVNARLREFGLDQEILRDVARQSYLAFANCTANHPPFFPAISAWGEAVRALREYLLPLGWTRSDAKNYSLVVDPSGRIAIAVATGNEGTGLIDLVPSTKCPKGPSTSAAVNLNQMELDLQFEKEDSRTSGQTDPRVMTWLLLMYRGNEEVRCELSLPSSMTSDGYIDSWRERILLGSIPLDSDELEIIPSPVLPDITVDVRRRA